MALVDWGTTDSRRVDAEEYCHRNGAIALKEKIEAYWAARGYAVEITIRDAGFHPAVRAARYDLRSNLKDGYPQGFQKSS